MGGSRRDSDAERSDRDKPNLSRQIAAEISDDDDVKSADDTKSDNVSASGAAVQSMRKQAE